MAARRRSYGYGGYDHGYGYGGWAPYVPVAQRRCRAQVEMNKLRKKGVEIQPITISGRTIATSFWGRAWCEHLESFSDFENRLPRGRSYVRNGSVCHLAIAKGAIEARVCGSELYTVKITIKPLAAAQWKAIQRRCSGQIGSLLELLQGRLSDQVMQVVTDRKAGLFPLPGEIHLRCSCPDWATMCKHVAAVLYGVGARLDHQPELLFTLRGVDHEELIAADAERAVTEATSRGKAKRLASSELSAVFGIELEDETAANPTGPASPQAAAGSRASRKRPTRQAVQPAPPSAENCTAGGKKRVAATGKAASKGAKKSSKSTAKKAVQPRKPAPTASPQAAKKQSPRVGKKRMPKP